MMSRLRAQQMQQMQHLHNLHHMRRMVYTGPRPLRLPSLNPLLFQLAFVDRDFDDNDYETLLALDSEVPSTHHGVSEEQLSALPSYVVPKHAPGDPSLDSIETVKGCGDEDINSQSSTCAICLDDMLSGETVRPLLCTHTFHAGCIDTWLRKNAVCPVCKHKV
eukprot:TRINITY_DN4524_c0_g1_i1.p1 TRINITY_DN4524_c0_g1~~TRINITY_DN4524_c0_g1_i1.p1  ORF type:complete len:163 (-),score=34.08 TRINITY_DN4524_c0_g1_i1:101-589(-)